MANETFKPFDASEYLETEEEIAAFLEEASADGDAASIALALGEVARARNMSKLARDVGMTRVGLYKALSAGGNPSLDTVARIAKGLGFTLGLRPVAAPSAVEGIKADIEKAAGIGRAMEAQARQAEETVKRSVVRREAKVKASV